METFSVLLVLCKGNPPVIPLTKASKAGLDVSFDLRMDKPLSGRQPRHRWLRHRPHYDFNVMFVFPHRYYSSFITYDAPQHLRTLRLPTLRNGPINHYSSYKIRGRSTRLEESYPLSTGIFRKISQIVSNDVIWSNRFIVGSKVSILLGRHALDSLSTWLALF